jgi:hypothetical protein
MSFNTDLIFIGLLLALLLVVILFLIPKEDNEMSLSAGIPPPPASRAKNLHLVTQWYRDRDPERQIELDYCFEKNTFAPFDRIIVVVTNPDVFPLSHPKITVVTTDERRPTFGYLFGVANEYSDSDTVTVIANSDIVFDESANKMRYLPQTHIISLAKWVITEFRGRKTDLSSAIEGESPHGSQDSWAFRGKIASPVLDIDFAPGVYHCDHALNARLNRAGYELFNPVYSIKSYHIHTIDSRHESNKVPTAKPWLFVATCSWDV